MVLIAEDNDTFRFVLERALARSGHEVVTVDDGGEIWPILDRENVTALLLDLKMPGMNGWEVLRRLREDFRYHAKRDALRVIVLSAQSDPQTRKFALRLGANHFLAKPVDLVELAELLSS